MKRRKRSGARVLWLMVVGTIFAVALVLFPLKGQRARAADSPAKTPAEATAGKTPKTKATKAAAPKDAAATPETAPALEPATPPEPPKALTTLPLEKGLPVRVNVAVFFLELGSFDDIKGEFEATVDVRMEWSDPRLAFSAKDTLRGYREFIGKEAEEQLTKMWSPTVDVQNRFEIGSYVGRRVRLFPDGAVETITRTSGKYKTHVNPEAFPFDRQKLDVELIVRDETVDEIRLRFDKEDVDFSRAAKDATIDGWDVGLVDLKRSVIAGWNGDRYSKVTATLFIDRQSASSLTSIFIPLIASLLIPLLALWMNKASDDGFEVDAFELANMGIGGLFSVIALSFAIYSANPIVAASDNTVTRLFGLNYAMLALSLTIVVVFFRYQLPRRWFGRYVQEEAFHYLSWAIPLLSLGTSIAFLFAAAA